MYIPQYLDLKKLKQNVVSISSALSPGFETGVPILIYEDIFTRLHYNEHILNTELVETSVLLAFFAYGFDRLRDALEYDTLINEDTTNEDAIINNDKKEMYDTIRENKTIIISILAVTFLEVNRILYESPINFYFSIPLVQCLIYKDLKPYLGIYKPLFISLMWAGACIILPSVMHDNSYDILKDPFCYIPCILSLWSTSSIADIKDVEEDSNSEIETIPVKYGVTNTKKMSLLGILLSSIIFACHHNYNSFTDGVFEIQNAVLSGMIFFY